MRKRKNTPRALASESAGAPMHARRLASAGVHLEPERAAKAMFRLDKPGPKRNGVDPHARGGRITYSED